VTEQTRTEDVSIQDTVAASSLVPSATSEVLGNPSMPARSTVLPRVEMVGDQTTLVARGKLRYETTRRLGEGGLGEVVGALDNDIGREVALKRLRPSMKSSSSVARFVEEVRTIGVLEHPNIVPIHDVGVDEHGDYYFVMKYVAGETLESIIEKLAAGDRRTHEQYGFERRAQIFLGLLEAVAFAHGKGIVHRDIKPANVMIGAYGEVVLMDWGVAKHLGDSASPPPVAHDEAASTNKRGPMFETKVGELVGTPAYMSPEQARGEPIDERSDVYSLSLLFHEFLCLRHPFADKTTLGAVLAAIVEETIPGASFVSSDHQTPVPADLNWFVLKGLEKKREDRYQSVNEMIERLQRRAEGDFPIQCRITFVKRMTNKWLRFVDHHPAVIAIGLIVLPLLLVTSVIALLLRGHGL